MSTLLLSAKTLPASLPNTLAVFPLTGAVLLPHARLPLNIFEPRYLAMVEDALGQGRMIGMIQPKSEVDDKTAALYSVGCVGKITSFSESDDGRLLIVLSGLCRFRVEEEIKSSALYRVVKPDWQPYLSDMDEDVPADIDRGRLLALMRQYFKKNAISVDWDVVENAPNDVLLPTIIMICPFEANEKQALLEAADNGQRAKMLMALLEMASVQQGDREGESRH